MDQSPEEWDFMHTLPISLPLHIKMRCKEDAILLPIPTWQVDNGHGHHWRPPHWLKDTRSLARTADYMDRWVILAIQIWLHQTWWWRQRLSKTLDHNSKQTQLIAPDHFTDPYCFLYFQLKYKLSLNEIKYPEKYALSIMGGGIWFWLHYQVIPGSVLDIQIFLSSREILGQNLKIRHDHFLYPSQLITYIIQYCMNYASLKALLN